MMEADAFPCSGLAGEEEMCCFLAEGYDKSNRFEGRILRAAALAVAKSGGGWMKNLKKCMECFGWCEVGVEEVKGLSCGEITTMLQACARRKVEDEYRVVNESQNPSSPC